MLKTIYYNSLVIEILENEATRRQNKYFWINEECQSRD